jgi:hypothetical protein
VISIIGPKGEIVFQQPGTQSSSEALLRAEGVFVRCELKHRENPLVGAKRRSPPRLRMSATGSILPV